MTLLRKKQNIYIALLLAILVFTGSFMFCDTTQYWGDDYAGYILEGRAIAQGTLNQQIQDNLFLHPSIIFGYDLEQMTELTYAWGYPLILSIIYRLVGFDMNIPQHILYYKIPGCIGLALFAAVLYLFFAKRFHFSISFALTAFAVLSILTYIDRIQTDFLFLAFTFLCFYWFELFRDADCKKSSITYGILLGAAMWFTYELRLNGFTVILLVILMHGSHLWKTKPDRSTVARQLLPYVVLGSLLLLSFLLMPTATSNNGDVGLGSLSRGLAYYYDNLTGWLYELTPFGYTPMRRLVSLALKAAFVIGFIWKGRKEEFWYALFLVGTVLVNASLPYDQGLRYVFNILPLILMFVMYGILFLCLRIMRLLKSPKYQKIFVIAVSLLAAGFCFIELKVEVSLLKNAYYEKAALQYNAQENAFADSCMDIYRYITANTEEDAVIAFMKPRVLYLNTGRKAFNMTVNGHTLWEGDYYLKLNAPTRWSPEVIPKADWEQLEPVYANSDFELYRIHK